VRDDPRRGQPALLVLGLVTLDAEAVVDMAVGEYRGVQWSIAPGSQRLVDARGEERAAGVDQHEPFVGTERAHVRKRGDERSVVGQRGELAPLPERMVHADVDVAPPESVGDVEQVGHLVRT